MPEITIRLPDIGEGIAEAEISEWMVEVGDLVREDDVFGVVLTDKAAVEIPSGVSGKVLWRAGEPGDMLAIGAPLIRFEVAEEDPGAPARAEPQTDRPNHSADGNAADTAPDIPAPTGADKGPVSGARPKSEVQPPSSRTLAAPAVRKRAQDLGLDLGTIPGTGPEGRVTHADLDRHLLGPGGGFTAATTDRVTETRIIGLRRKIAEQMARANARVPQITIVEEIDVTELERLRAQMNAESTDPQARLTMLPFVIRGVVAARAVAPQVNARYDDEEGVLHQYDAVHFGIAVQTERGLVVPVLRHAEARSIRDSAAEIARLSASARDGSLAREELAGGTITVTSLGPLGAVATTPIVNHPEVAIVGVNRKQVRPLWNGRDFAPREMMNVSASFDHRIVDGWDAAHFISRLKVLLETPALLFT